MEKLYQDYKAVEDTLGETLLVLVVAKRLINDFFTDGELFNCWAGGKPPTAEEIARSTG